jgi:hypothetical protein
MQWGQAMELGGRRNGSERRHAMQRNSTTTMSTTSLLPFTRLVLVVSAVVQLVFGLVGLFFTPQLWNTVFWTAPLPAWPVEAMRFASLTYVTTALAALYALSQGSWDGARVSFAFSFPYIVLSVLAALVTAISPGVP